MLRSNLNSNRNTTISTFSLPQSQFLKNLTKSHNTEIGKWRIYGKKSKGNFYISILPFKVGHGLVLLPDPWAAANDTEQINRLTNHRSFHIAGLYAGLRFPRRRFNFSANFIDRGKMYAMIHYIRPPHSAGCLTLNTNFFMAAWLCWAI